MFGFIKSSLQKIYAHITSKLASFFSQKTIDLTTLAELELLLIQADTGVKTTRSIIERLKEAFSQGTLQSGDDLRAALKHELTALLEAVPSFPGTASRVFVMVGVNGTGKTTFASKLAQLHRSQGKRVLFVAADTFRAAAPEQLSVWAQTCGASIERGNPGQDPAAVVFAGCERFKKERFDTIIIDTAGRLHNKVNLMGELAKIKRVVSKQLPDEHVCTLLTIDAMLGQNSFEQAKLFKECTDVQGIVLTKMDGTGKGGIVFAIAQELGIPVAYISYGEQVHNLKAFDHTAYIEELLA
jgi:fused signal recognition particle receptor